MEGLFECLVPDEAAPAEKRGSEDTARARSDDAEGVDIGIIKTTSLAGGLSTAYKAAVTSLALKGPLIKI